MIAVDSLQCFSFSVCSVTTEYLFVQGICFLDPCTKDTPKGSDLHFQPGFGKIQFLFVGQSLYLYILLFIGSTPSPSCVSATLKLYIYKTDKYLSASNITLTDRYV